MTSWDCKRRISTTTVQNQIRPLTVAILIGDEAIARDVEASLEQTQARLVARHLANSDFPEFVEEVERVRPEVVVLGLADLPMRAEDAIRRIRGTSAAPVVVAVHTATEPDAVLSAIRAGAAEYVYPPVPQHLAEAVARIAAERASNPDAIRRGKTVAFLSAKGGCGATTVACHVAQALRQQTGKTTLLADFDTDNGVIGFVTKSKSSYSVADALQNIERLDPSYWAALVSKAGEGMDILTAPDAGQAQTAGGEGLKAVLEFAGSQYDWTLIDLGRGLGQATLKALEAVDEIYLVTTLDVPALYRCQQTVRSLLDLGVARDRIHLVINRVSKRAELTRDELEKLIGLAVGFELPEESALADAYVEGKLLPPDNGLARRMARIARQISGVPEEPSNGLFNFSWLAKKNSGALTRHALAARG